MLKLLIFFNKSPFVENYYTCEKCAKSYEYKLVSCNNGRQMTYSLSSIIEGLRIFEQNSQKKEEEERERVVWIIAEMIENERSCTPEDRETRDRIIDTLEELKRRI